MTRFGNAAEVGLAAMSKANESNYSVRYCAALINSKNILRISLVPLQIGQCPASRCYYLYIPAVDANLFDKIEQASKNSISCRLRHSRSSL